MIAKSTTRRAETTAGEMSVKSVSLLLLSALLLLALGRGCAAEASGAAADVRAAAMLRRL